MRGGHPICYSGAYWRAKLLSQEQVGRWSCSKLTLRASNAHKSAYMPPELSGLAHIAALSCTLPCISLAAAPGMCDDVLRVGRRVRQARERAPQEDWVQVDRVDRVERKPPELQRQAILVSRERPITLHYL